MGLGSSKYIGEYLVEDELGNKVPRLHFDFSRNHSLNMKLCELHS